ncbi:uncharacterized protein PV09_08196 [Verruconis gallopava]|uniref:Beta-lactamase-related domain-containing protein n=1 Tax=Verruconis gallopava TaxID=253628 RepID=A0A0D2AME7_9PEZI|nr:uncharacterized protein PV09_08196 [Verruconis gallopava]KIW00309.1 hypothetical protein PV09_08196 [Verruconis gallopava]
MGLSAIKSKEFDSQVQRLLVEWKVPGIALAVVDANETYVKNFGFSNIEEGKLVDDKTLFDCGSTSKSFTAAAVALVIEDCQKKEDSRIAARSFETPVNEFLPDDFVLSDPQFTKNVTVEDILSHRSGMPRHDDSYLGIRAEKPDNPKSITRNLRNLPLSKPLRTTYQYCNMMYTVAAHLVAETSGQSFSDFLRERIWTPLEMTNTYLNIPGTSAFEHVKSNLATGYYWSEVENVQKPLPFFDQPEGLGAGSVFSTVSDYAKWIKCMLKQSKPLSKSSHEELKKPRTIACPERQPKNGFSHILYALGWEVCTYRGHQIVGHDGTVWGFAACMKFLPHLDCGIVLFANGNEGANSCIETIAMMVIDNFVEVQASIRLDWHKINMEKFRNDTDNDDEGDKNLDDAEMEASSGLKIADYAGCYRNKGYHAIILDVKEDHLHANCTDRSFPFYLDLWHLSGNRFRARIRDHLDGQSWPVKVAFELEELSKKPARFGIELEQALDGDLIWFDRVEKI